MVGRNLKRSASLSAHLSEDGVVAWGPATGILIAVVVVVVASELETRSFVPSQTPQKPFATLGPNVLGNHWRLRRQKHLQFFQSLPASLGTGGSGLLHQSCGIGLMQASVHRGRTPSEIGRPLPESQKAPPGHQAATRSRSQGACWFPPGQDPQSGGPGRLRLAGSSGGSLGHWASV